MEIKVAAVVISSIVLTLGFFISFFNHHVGNNKSKPEVNLAVCILSARDNFGLRDAIRNTWLSDVNRLNGSEDASLLAKFIIGSKACPIHPDHRLSPYSCEAWNPQLPANPSDELASFAASLSNKDTRDCAFTSVSFLIMHDIILKRVGILELFPFAMTDDVQVVLFDTISMEEIGRTRFIPSQQGSIFQGFKYRPVEKMILPKGYQLTVKLETPVLDNLPRVVENFYSANSSRFAGGETHHGLLFVQSVISVVPSLQHACSLHVPLTSVMFTILDIPLLDDLVKGQETKTRKWMQELSSVSAQIVHEVTKYDDIVMVDVVDVYRNLPTKLLLCHQWLLDEYQPRFVMKADDDVYLNITNVVSGLARMDASKAVWWGSFRREWRVDRHGKWKEDQFADDVYPDFACGSGNVVSASVHTILAQNTDSFKVFQGEDVSMGIWLSPFRVAYIDDPRWRCDLTCTHDFMTLPQLDIDSIQWYRNTSLLCSDPCQSC